MDNKSGQSKVLGRRRTLQVIGLGIGAATGLLALGGCKDKGGAPAGGDTKGGAGGGAQDCSATIDEASKAQRKTLQYKKVATVPEKRCSACAQYSEKTFGECGGCKLFTGPVQPEGGCLSFAPKGAEGGVPN